MGWVWDERQTAFSAFSTTNPLPHTNATIWQIWGGGLPPGQSFDAGGVSPTLQRLLDSGELGVEGKRFLVPGCGRGYDAYAAARAGASIAVGLDLSAKAVAAAEGHHSREPADVRARVRLVAGDFFAFQDEQPFDLGYDYTFREKETQREREFVCVLQTHGRDGVYWGGKQGGS